MAARRDLGQITLAAERAASLMRQLLASVRREVVRPQVLDLDHGVTDVQEMLRRTRGEHAGLVTTLAVDLWPILASTPSSVRSWQAPGATYRTACRPGVAAYRQA